MKPFEFPVHCVFYAKGTIQTANTEYKRLPKPTKKIRNVASFDFSAKSFIRRLRLTQNTVAKI